MVLSHGWMEKQFFSHTLVLTLTLLNTTRDINLQVEPPHWIILSLDTQSLQTIIGDSAASTRLQRFPLRTATAAADCPAGWGGGSPRGGTEWEWQWTGGCRRWRERRRCSSAGGRARPRNPPLDTSSPAGEDTTPLPSCRQIKSKAKFSTNTDIFPFFNR